MLVLVFSCNTLISPVYGQNLAQMVLGAFDPVYYPLVIKGVGFDYHNPFHFDFILDTGSTKLKDQEAIKQQSKELIEYFLLGLTIPEKDLWVNLSMYEQDRIIPDSIDQTVLGKAFLNQDYSLKKLTSTLTMPESKEGQQFWKEVYKKIYDLYGTTVVPVDILNKVWIVPGDAEVIEYRDKAFITKSSLKVMLEEDYLALKQTTEDRGQTTEGTKDEGASASLGRKTISPEQREEINKLSVEVMKKEILPLIEKQINTSKDFASLRQLYNSLILATYFKNKLKQSIHYAYINQNKTAPLQLTDTQIKDKIYQQYIDLYKKGVYDYIKKEYDPYEQKTLKRRYVSGGLGFTGLAEKVSSSAVENPMEAVSAIEKGERGKTIKLAISLLVAGSMLLQPSATILPEYQFGNKQEMASQNETLSGRVITKEEIENQINAHKDFFPPEMARDIAYTMAKDPVKKDEILQILFKNVKGKDFLESQISIKALIEIRRFLSEKEGATTMFIMNTLYIVLKDSLDDVGDRVAAYTNKVEMILAFVDVFKKDLPQMNLSEEAIINDTFNMLLQRLVDVSLSTCARYMENVSVVYALKQLLRKNPGLEENIKRFLVKEGGFLTHPSPMARVNAVMLVREILPLKQALIILTGEGMGINDPDSHVRSQVVLRLGEYGGDIPTGDKNRIKQIIEDSYRDDSAPEVRLATVYQIGTYRSGTERIRLLLKENRGIYDASPEVRNTALQSALHTLRDESIDDKVLELETVEKLFELTQQDTFSHRFKILAAQYLSKFLIRNPGKASQEKIRALLEFVGDAEVRNNITSVIEGKPDIFKNILGGIEERFQDTHLLTPTEFNILIYSLQSSGRIYPSSLKARAKTLLLSIFGKTSGVSQEEKLRYYKMAYDYAISISDRNWRSMHLFSLASVVNSLSPDEKALLARHFPDSTEQLNKLTSEKQTPPYEWIFNKKFNPEQNLNIRLYAPLVPQLWHSTLISGGYAFKEENGLSVYTNQINGKKITILLDSTGDPKDYKGEIFKYIEDQETHIIAYDGHSGMGTTFAFALEQAPQNDLLQAGNKVIAILSCNSVQGYFSQVKQRYPYTQFVGTKKSSGKSTGPRILVEVIKGLAEEQNWETIKSNVEQALSGSDESLSFPNELVDQMKYFGVEYGRGNQADTSNIIFVPVAKISLSDNDSLEIEQGYVDIAQIQSDKPARVVSQVETAFSYNDFLKDIKIEPGIFRVSSTDEENLVFVSAATNTESGKGYKISLNVGYRNKSQAALNMMALHELNMHFSKLKKGEITTVDKIRGLQLVAEFAKYYHKEDLFQRFLQKYGYPNIPVEDVVKTLDMYSQEERTGALPKLFQYFNENAPAEQSILKKEGLLSFLTPERWMFEDESGDKTFRLAGVDYVIPGNVSSSVEGTEENRASSAMEAPTETGGIDLSTVWENLKIKQEMEQMDCYYTQIEPYLPLLGDIRTFAGYGFQIDGIQRTSIKQFLFQ